MTNFLEDHPGGAKALMLYAGRDATEEFNMLHDKVRDASAGAQADAMLRALFRSMLRTRSCVRAVMGAR